MAFLFNYNLVLEGSFGWSGAIAVLSRDRRRYAGDVHIIALRLALGYQLVPALRIGASTRLFFRENYVNFGSDPYGLVTLDEGRGKLISPMLELTIENVWGSDH